MAVASETAMFSLSEVKIGLMPATISPYVVAAIGARAARRYFTTAERFSAARAQELGLVSELVAEDDALDSAVEALLGAILGNSPAAVAASKALVYEVADRPVDEALIEMTCQRIADIRASAEGQEGLSAFLEKRKPAWIQ